MYIRHLLENIRETTSSERIFWRENQFRNHSALHRQQCSCSAVAQLCTGHKKLVKTSRGTTNGSSCVSWPPLQPLAHAAQSAKLLCNNLERPLVDGLAADSWLKPKAPNGHGEIEINDTSAHYR